MCKPGKSFNTGIKSYSLRHMKMPCKSSRAGGAPPRTDALIGPAAFGDVQKTDCLKRRASGAPPSLLLTLWHGLNISETPRSCALQRAPVRWTLTLKTNHLWSLGPCQCRNTTEQRLQRRAFPVTSRSRGFPKEHEPTTWNPRQRTHAGKRNQRIQPALNQQKASNKPTFLILTKPLKFNLNAVTKQTYFVRDLFLLS